MTLNFRSCESRLFSPLIRLAILLLLLLVLQPGCATHSQIRSDMVDDVRRGRYSEAMQELEKIHKDASEKDLVMDLMDLGLLLHRLGYYEKSNTTLEKAKDKLDKLYGVSISDELVSIAWNEASRAFEGEEFEQVMVNMVKTFNYLHLGDLEAAGVEARQINHRLQMYVDRLARNKVKSSYVQDPFAQFLAGLIQESSGDNNDAFRSYENAYEGYLDLEKYIGLKPPRALKASLLRAARRLGYEEAIEKYEPLFGKYPLSRPESWKGKAKLVVIVALGKVAHKKSEKWIIPDPQFDTIVVTYPKFERGAFIARGAVVSVGKRPVRAGMVHDLSTLAITALDDKNEQVKGRAIAKTILRYAAKKVTKTVAMASDNQTVQAVSLLANIALNVHDMVEEADTRSWMTLPDHYRMAIFNLPPGKHPVSVAIEGGRGVIDRQRFEMYLNAGETRFLIVRGREPGAGKPDPPAAPLENKRKRPVTSGPAVGLLDASLQ